MPPELYEHQRVGVEWLTVVGRGLLGDDRGLGKTAQALLAVQKLPLLILSPKSVLIKWSDEMLTWRPDLYDEATVMKWENTQRKQLALNTRPRVVVANYDMMSQRTKGTPAFAEASFIKRQWGTIIADEAQYLRVRSSRRTKQSYRMNAEDVFLLTASPVTTRPDDVWSMVHLLHPKEYPSFWKWAEEYCWIEEQYYGSGRPVREVIGWRAEKLNEFLREFGLMYLRRTKEEVMPDLPPRIPARITVELPSAERARYHALEKQMLLEYAEAGFELIPSVAEKLVRLRQLLTAHQAFGFTDLTSKQEAVCELVEDCLADTEKVVVFTWFQPAAEAITAELIRRGISTSVAHGGVKYETREALRKAFQEQLEPRVFVGTISTIGLGIDLHRANVAIFTEKSYDPEENEQAMDRVHRIGQDKPVTVYTVTARDTIDDDVEVVLALKRELIIGPVWMSTAVLKSRLASST